MSPASIQPDLWFVTTQTPNQPKIDEAERAKARAHAAKMAFRNKQSNGSSLPNLLKGNSDPFSSLAITLTPRITYALNFRKAYYIPACPFSRHPPWAVTEAQDRHENGHDAVVIHKEMSELRKPGSANAFALYLISVQAQIWSTDRGWTIYMSKLKVVSINTVRQLIEGGKSREAASAMHWLFAGAVLSGNIEEAYTHGTALKKLIMSDSNEKTSLRNSDLIDILWLDSHWSMMSMRRPIFDHEWTSSRLGHTSSTIDAVFPRSVDHDLCVPDCLHSLLTQFRSSLQAWEAPSLPLADCEATKLMSLIVANSHIRKGRLISLYLDNANNLTGCMALAALCLELTQGCDPAFGKRRLLPSMQRVVKQFYAAMSMWVQPGNAELWCLFVGAYIEQRESENPSSLWFSSAFASLASRMGYSSWLQIRDVVKQIFYNETFEPAGELWVDRMLQTAVRSAEEPKRLEIKSWVQLEAEL